jgi:hypothetical protein
MDHSRCWVAVHNGTLIHDISNIITTLTLPPKLPRDSLLLVARKNPVALVEYHLRVQKRQKWRNATTGILPTTQYLFNYQVV